MTSTKAITIAFIIGVLTVAAGFFEMSNAGDMDCFRLESAQAQYNNVKGLNAKIKAKKMVTTLTLLCNQSI